MDVVGPFPCWLHFFRARTQVLQNLIRTLRLCRHILEECIPSALIVNDSALSSTKVCGCFSVRFSCSPIYLLIRFMQWNLCCTSESTMKHRHKSDSKMDFSWFSYGYRKYMFLDWVYRSFLIVFSPIEDVVQYLFLVMCLSDVCSLILTWPHTDQIKIDDQEK